MLQQGVDIRIIQMLLGHSTIRSTEIYTHLTNPLRDQLRQLLFQTTDGLFQGRSVQPWLDRKHLPAEGQHRVSGRRPPFRPTIRSPQYGQGMMPSQKKALSDIAACCTRELGGRLYRCDDCQDTFWHYHCFCNRVMPQMPCKPDPAMAPKSVKPELLRLWAIFTLS